MKIIKEYVDEPKCKKRTRDEHHIADIEKYKFRALADDLRKDIVEVFDRTTGEWIDTKLIRRF